VWNYNSERLYREPSLSRFTGEMEKLPNEQGVKMLLDGDMEWCGI